MKTCCCWTAPSWSCFYYLCR